jgi:HK97 family phage major capsid protein
MQVENELYAKSQEISESLAEAKTISGKAVQTKQDEQRFQFLMQKVSVLKSRAMTVDEFRTAQLNDVLKRDGKAIISSHNPLSPERRALVNAYTRIAAAPDEYTLGQEIRAVQQAGILTLANPSLAVGGAFVPVKFLFSELQVALKKADPLYNPDVCTVIQTESGASMQIPLVSDVSVYAAQVGEAISDTTATNLADLAGVTSNVFMYRTPKIRTSMEFLQDAADVTVSMLEQFFVERLERGVGRDLITGNAGTAGINGIIAQLETLGVTPVTATGSASNDGSAATGANSIGTDDLYALYSSVDAAYRASAKCGWLMNDNTFLALQKLKDQSGRPLYLVQYDMRNGWPTLFNKNIHISPSMPNIGVSNTPIIFGDLSRWLTRIVPSHVIRYQEAPGLVEAGVVGWQCFSRFGGTLLATDPNASPLNYIRNHS